MKKLLIGLFSIFIGCGYAPMDNSKNIVITAIAVDDETYCRYYGNGARQMVSTPVSPNFMFRDTCGKFQIGDTINFVKQ